MDLSNFVINDKKDSLLLGLAKSNMDIVESTLSKPQETLEFKMKKQKESFSFDVPLELPEQWMMGVPSLEVYNTVYNITEKNNKLKIFLKDVQLKSLNIDTQLVINVEYLYKTSDTARLASRKIEKVNKLIVNCCSRKTKLTRKYFDYLKKIFDQNNLDTTTLASHKDNMNIPEFGIENDFLEIELKPGVNDLVDINDTIKQILSDSDFEFNIQADTISMKSDFTTSNDIHFNSELNTFLGFTNTNYFSGNHKSEKTVMITTTDNVLLKCDCVDGSIVNGKR